MKVYTNFSSIILCNPKGYTYSKLEFLKLAAQYRLLNKC